MSDTLTAQEMRTRILKMEQKVNAMHRMMDMLLKKQKPSEWMDEKEVMDLLSIKIRFMRTLRTKGVIKGYSSTGRKFKYKRSEVMEFLEGHKANEVHQLRQQSKSIHQ